MKLTDPWFEASFQFVLRDGRSTRVETLDEANAVEFYCPCRYGLQDEGVHGLLIPIANPKVAAAPGDQAWAVQGTGLHDLTLTPSIHIGATTGTCWHGFITSGVIT